MPQERIQEEKDRVLVCGVPNLDRCDNRVRTSKYTAVSFLPVAILEQFRRFANLYFLLVGVIMAIGYYFPDLFESAISPWTTLGPLAVVISFSLLVEGSADYKRHVNDEETNNAPCVVLQREDTMMQDDDDVRRDPNILNGKSVPVSLKKNYTTLDEPSQSTVKVAFSSVRRKNIRQGHLVLVKNREMVPADIILLASSNDQGTAYIETSSIDGETNLKLRNSATFPMNVRKSLWNQAQTMDTIEESKRDEGDDDDDPKEAKNEGLLQATQRLTRVSALANPAAISAIEHPHYVESHPEVLEAKREPSRRRSSIMEMVVHGIGAGVSAAVNRTDKGPPPDGHKYAATLTSEPPNPHVNTFSGKLTLPPLSPDGRCLDIPLGAENILLRGAVLRNTEWVLGLACFTGSDTKLVQNSFETPSKFSRLDILMNKTVFFILGIMILCIGYLATQAVFTQSDQFDNLWYVGYNKDTNERWPTFADLDPPEWSTTSSNWIQTFFLYVTLLNNFVPLSLYVTVEFISFVMIWLINVDQDMYDDTTNTRAVARSTIVTDLGQVQYIFSDKTGTLTQNVMRFKRCSVDGMIFGAPIQKTKPVGLDQDDYEPSPFQPLRHLLAAPTAETDIERKNSRRRPSEGLQGLGGSTTTDKDERLTFNAEMFLRVLSLCHTVVVEKDLDQKEMIDGGRNGGDSNSLSLSEYAKKLFRKKKTSSGGDSGASGTPDPTDSTPASPQPNKPETSIEDSARAGVKGKDGAPVGFAYQAESPDEGALVEAASLKFGFQVIARDSSGIRLYCSSPSYLEDARVVDGLKSGRFTPKSLAANPPPSHGESSGDRFETWTILAVNKFDSDRKRMSILLRSPPELGSVVMLLCKGADSAMLDPEVCPSVLAGMTGDTPVSSGPLSPVSEDAESSGRSRNDVDMGNVLRMQSHLGDFATEGLRTLVLGIRMLSETEFRDWMDVYNAAATSIKNRDEMLKDAAIAIERELHIVGATAIEDKLQTGVPSTIATLEKAGIKLWVLTGDKRETAIEIGYSTHVLTPKMHLSEFADKGVDHVRAQMAMEFIRLVKMGRLTEYQRKALNAADSNWSKENALYKLGKFNRRLGRAMRRFVLLLKICFRKCLGKDTKRADLSMKTLEEEEAAEDHILRKTEQRRRVRDRAEAVIKDFLAKNEDQGKRSRAPKKTDEVKEDEEGFELQDLPLASGELPQVFNRAQSARLILDRQRTEGEISQSDLRALSLAQLTAAQSESEKFLIDEDVLSLRSFFPDADNELDSDFDRQKRTMLEKWFAVDRDVRKGLLIKHMRKDKRAEVLASLASPEKEAVTEPKDEAHGPRALVIEGAALKHLLGDAELEQLLFAVASSCDAVIACRVSPKQKALLVNLVRHHVEPEPVTLAIGDGANDVGMIQEAHVGVGISGKEGKQAVNASDFAIAQFRFLEELVLIHGRWNFFRMSIVVLFSFYKNAVMAGCLIVFTGKTVYSGTPLFDEWVIAMLNFVAAFPILTLGMFDRCLDKDYVRNHPEVYKPTRNNELMTMRTLLRWALVTFGHIFTIYYLTVPQQSLGGGYTSAFEGLMSSKSSDSPGDGEGGDLLSVGTVTYTVLIIILSYKVLYESKSLIHGHWPAFTCRKGVGEGFFSRVAYTWHSATFLSIGFYLFAIAVYQLIGRSGAGTFSAFVDVTNHILGTRTTTWMLIWFVPIAGMIFDVAAKLFSNMFYPTQTQIHIEIEARQKGEKRRAAKGGVSRNEEANDSRV